MKYFVVSIQKIGENSPCTITSYDNDKDAYSAYHSILASNYISETLDAFSVVVLNEHGGTEIKEYFVKPLPVSDGE